MKKKGTTPCCTRLVTLLLQVCNSRPPNPNETDSLMISSHQVQNLPEPCSLTTWIHLTHLDTQRQQFWRTNISNVQLSGDSFQVAKGSSCAAPRYSATEAPRAIRPSCPEQNWIQLIHGVRTSIALSEPRLRWTSSFGSSESPVVAGHSESFATCVSVFRHIGTSTWSCIKDTNGEMQTTDFFNTRPRIAISSVQRCRDTKIHFYTFWGNAPDLGVGKSMIFRSRWPWPPGYPDNFPENVVITWLSKTQHIWWQSVAVKKNIFNRYPSKFRPNHLFSSIKTVKTAGQRSGLPLEDAMDGFRLAVAEVLVSEEALQRLGQEAPTKNCHVKFLSKTWNFHLVFF